MTQPTRIRWVVSSKPKAILLAIACAAVGGLGLLLAFRFLTASQVTSSAASPNHRFRAEVVDRSFPSIDRNFQLRIVDGDGNWRTVFRSPDEPPSGIGQERLLWSEDSQRLLLVGKFWGRESAQLANGECLYLLYDLASGQVWCNSDQQGPSFDPKELEGFDFREPLTMKP
jgi:hypothetical protein